MILCNEGKCILAGKFSDVGAEFLVILRSIYEEDKQLMIKLLEIFLEELIEKGEKENG